jgi:hypothetical protein
MPSLNCGGFLNWKDSFMRRFSLSLIFVVFFAAVTVFAVPLQRFFQDAKLPTQSMLEHQLIDSPILASTNRIKTTYAGATSAAIVTLTSFTAQPDVPRNITITPTGTTGDVEACVIVVNGTNFFGDAISENFTFLADASTAQTGSKAFKTVTSVVWPANCESGSFAATWIIGVGSKLGLKRCMDLTGGGDIAWTSLGGVKETTLGIGVGHASAIESNTITPNGTMDGSKDVDVWFVQNFACFP